MQFACDNYKQRKKNQLAPTFLNLTVRIMFMIYILRLIRRKLMLNAENYNDNGQKLCYYVFNKINNNFFKSQHYSCENIPSHRHTLSECDYGSIVMLMCFFDANRLIIITPRDIDLTLQICK